MTPHQFWRAAFFAACITLDPGTNAWTCPLAADGPHEEYTDDMRIDMNAGAIFDSALVALKLVFPITQTTDVTNALSQAASVSTPSQGAYPTLFLFNVENAVTRSGDNR